VNRFKNLYLELQFTSVMLHACEAWAGEVDFFGKQMANITLCIWKFKPVHCWASVQLAVVHRTITRALPGSWM